MSWYLLRRAFASIACAFAGHRWVPSVFKGVESCQRCDAKRFA